MRKKFLIFTLCFTLLFSSFNFNNSYAVGGLLSSPMLSVVSALAVGSGIVLNNNDDLYDIGRLFSDYVSYHNDLTWDTVNLAFSSVSALPNKYISVNSDFLDIVKGFFDSKFTDSNKDISLPHSGKGVPGNFYSPCVSGKLVLSSNAYMFITSSKIDIYLNDVVVHSYTIPSNFKFVSFKEIKQGYVYYDVIYNGKLTTMSYKPSGFNFLNSSVGSLPYSGGYTWDNVENKREDDKSVALPIPGNLGQLVGQGSSDFWGNTDNLVGNGDLSIPVVDNPSIGIDGSVSFPGVSSPDVPGVDSPSVPNEGIWSAIKEFVIGLVVPSDTYWTDTWGGLYNNFTNSFPMVDMDGFNDLVTGEKKFPNIDINIMGVRGRVVNGDVVNSIVDWLRPIIAGFMMLCLMFFNYRKIYKLIRNSEPFGGIAPGTSDFSTGISEYSKQEVVKATDMVAEYRAWKERGVK